MGRENRDRLITFLSEPNVRGTNAEQAKNTLALTEVLEEHAQALTKAAEASDKISRGLMWATVALAAATVALVFATLLPLFASR